MKKIMAVATGVLLYFAQGAQAEDVMARAYAAAFFQAGRSGRQMLERRDADGRGQERAWHILAKTSACVAELRRREAGSSPRTRALDHLSDALPGCLAGWNGAIDNVGEAGVHCSDQAAVTAIARAIRQLGATVVKTASKRECVPGFCGFVPPGTRILRQELDFRPEGFGGGSIQCVIVSAGDVDAVLPTDTPWCRVNAPGSESCASRTSLDGF